jgi:hypothetical protein
MTRNFSIPIPIPENGWYLKNNDVSWLKNWLIGCFEPF